MQHRIWSQGWSPADGDPRVPRSGAWTHYICHHVVELADGAQPVNEVAFGKRTCLALGHEDRGLSSTVLAACDAVAYIPQLGKVGSLNVGTAAGIALYELNRRNW